MTLTGAFVLTCLLAANMEKPTPKALSERLLKIRKSAGLLPAGGGGSAPNTPRAARTFKASPKGTPKGNLKVTPGSKKRKLAKDLDEDEDEMTDDDDIASPTTNTPTANLNVNNRTPRKSAAAARGKLAEIKKEEDAEDLELDAMAVHQHVGYDVKGATSEEYVDPVDAKANQQLLVGQAEMLASVGESKEVTADAIMRDLYREDDVV